MYLPVFLTFVIVFHGFLVIEARSPCFCRYGYKDSVPFQCVSWEEDQLTWIPDHCRTIWLKSTWDEVRRLR